MTICTLFIRLTSRRETDQSVGAVVRLLSAPRIARFQMLTGSSDQHDAIDLYTLNAELSGAFIFPIAMLEVAFRNKCDGLLSHSYGTDWMTNGNIRFDEWQSKEIAGGKNAVHSHTFGFWTSMLSRNHHVLWNTDLNNIFSFANVRITRKIAAGHMHRIRTFRNRIGHHEQILTYDPAGTHELILHLLAMMQPEVAVWTRQHSNVTRVLKKLSKMKKRWPRSTF